jgi:crotonobetainyl-CoA:carnitine CoA-transferase CaiB-like acyl-CoA transferase
MKPGALSKLRILDLSQARAGPNCARQFADFGADVIRVEPLSGSGRGELYTGERDGPDMQNLHRNKRSIAIDLKDPAGVAAFKRLVARADVVIENFRPDVKVRLGIDYESLEAVNARIILASISGFGQDGPYSNRPGFDQVIQGMCGLMSTTGRPGDTPTRAGAAVIDMTTGWIAAAGILTALLEREASGKGQWVQVSLLHSGISLMDFQAARYLMEGVVPRQMGNDHPTSMPTSTYPTKDGHINIGAGGDAMWRKLCEVIGRPELGPDPAFATDAQRVANRAQINELLSIAFRERPSAFWIDQLNEIGVPCGPILSMDQVFADEQVRHSGIAAPVEHPTRGTIRLVAQPVVMSRTPASIVSACGPKGEHTNEILAEAGLDAAEIETLRRAGVVQDQHHG